MIAFTAAAGAGWSFAQRGPHTRDSVPEPASTSVSQPEGRDEASVNRLDRRFTGTRLREGTELREVPGQFLQVDGRFEFASADGVYRLRMLENLALERAARKVSDSPQGVVWNVSGIVTEYEGANYLLVKRIVVDATLAPASP